MVSGTYRWMIHALNKLIELTFTMFNLYDIINLTDKNKNKGGGSQEHIKVYLPGKLKQIKRRNY